MDSRQQSDEQSGGETTREAHFSPNDHGIEYEDFDEGDRVRLYSCVTESVATGVVRRKELNESMSGDKYYADITVDIDRRHLHSGTVSSQEFCELPQIREVLEQ